VVAAGAGDVGDGDGLVVGLGLGDGDGLVVGLGLGEGLTVGEGDGLGLGDGWHDVIVPELDAVPVSPWEFVHDTFTVTVSPFSGEMGKETLWVEPLHVTEWLMPSMVTVADCPGSSGNSENVTSTESQSMVILTALARAAVAAPRTKPVAISSTAAVLDFGLMPPPSRVAANRVPRFVNRSWGCRSFVPHSVGRLATGDRGFWQTTAKRGQARRAGGPFFWLAAFVTQAAAAVTNPEAPAVARRHDRESRHSTGRRANSAPTSVQRPSPGDRGSVILIGSDVSYITLSDEFSSPSTCG
jgi:hypothetical protein